MKPTRLFTFSGISGSLSETNEGQGLVRFAQDIIGAMPASRKPAYNSTLGDGHFISHVTLGKLLSNLKTLFTLDGSDELNAEARALAPQYAGAIINQTTAIPVEDILILAHSQGSNNLAFTLKHLFSHHPAFFQGREVRCAFFDPKTGPSLIEDIIALDRKQQVRLLFFQSQNDVLGNQTLGTPDFIRAFPHGNHLWVRGLDHTSIREWDSFRKPADWMNLGQYLTWSREYRKKVIEEKRKHKNALNTAAILRIQRWIKKYPMNTHLLSEGLLGFLNGNLPAKFKS